MNSSKVVLGILGGAVAGALIGVLFAPAKGSKTRKRIANKGKDYVGDLKDKFENLYQEVSNKYENFISEAKEEVAKEVK